MRFKNQVALPKVVVTVAAEQAAFAALAAFAKAERELALPKRLRTRGVVAIHRDVLTTDRVARSLQAAL